MWTCRSQVQCRDSWSIGAQCKKKGLRIFPLPSPFPFSLAHFLPFPSIDTVQLLILSFTPSIEILFLRQSTVVILSNKYFKHLNYVQQLLSLTYFNQPIGLSSLSKHNSVQHLAKVLISWATAKQFQVQWLCCNNG